MKPPSLASRPGTYAPAPTIPAPGAGRSPGPGAAEVHVDQQGPHQALALDQVQGLAGVEGGGVPVEEGVLLGGGHAEAAAGEAGVRPLVAGAGAEAVTRVTRLEGDWRQGEGEGPPSRGPCV